MRRILAVLSLFMFVAVACGEGKPTGQQLNRPIGKAQECKLGEKCPTPTPSPAGGEKNVLGATSPTPPPPPPPTQDPIAVTITIPEGANYEPAIVEVGVGATIRVINKDCRPEVPTRSYTARDGTFDSGPIACGKAWIHKTNVIGKFDLMDNSGFPVSGSLTVTG